MKDQQRALFADPTSTHARRSHQRRLYFPSFASVLMHTLRRLGLNGTAMAKTQCETMRVKLFKIGAHLQLSVRRVRIAFSDRYPYTDVFRQILRRLHRIPLRGSLRIVSNTRQRRWCTPCRKLFAWSSTNHRTSLTPRGVSAQKTYFLMHSAGSKILFRFTRHSLIKIQVAAEAVRNAG